MELGGHYRRIKSYRPDEVGRSDEKCEKFDRENRVKRASICVMWVRSVMLRILIGKIFD